MKQKIKIQSVFKYLFLFCYFFYCLVLAYNLTRGDSYVNFGFSYADEIGRNGEFLYEVCEYVIEHFSLVAREGDYLIYEAKD